MEFLIFNFNPKVLCEVKHNFALKKDVEFNLGPELRILIAFSRNEFYIPRIQHCICLFDVFL